MNDNVIKCSTEKNFRFNDLAFILADKLKLDDYFYVIQDSFFNCIVPR